ncbi:MAG: hypothetical protein L0211_06260 [Planctomycetaceae bacterium]|nr:hypothetical protein [Planctomycetaceae bacterium]
MKSTESANEANPWLAMAGSLKDSPLFDEWKAAVEEYRRQCDVRDGVELDRPYPKPEGRMLAAICEADFQLNEMYTRHEINEVLGGSVRSFLPTVNGEVVCGCFDPSDKMNPHAPEEILFGEPYPTPVIDKAATTVFEMGQRGEDIPVFLKRGSNQWEYIGRYLCIGLTRDARVVRRKSEESPDRRPFVGILRFERVGSHLSPLRG